MEIMSGRGTPAGGVLLDASHIPDVARHFAGMCERCREYGFDLVNDRVEVSPSAHYHMGGIKIDVNCRTNIDGLFAAGEDTGGVHGANRLGGNGVADSIVFGARAGDTMAAYIGGAAAATGISRAHVQQICERWMEPLTCASGENPFALRDRLERLMWNKVGVVRNGADMQSALSEIQEIRASIKSVSACLSPSPSRGGGNPPSSIYNAPWNEAINTENLALVAEMITHSALARQESRGAHFRNDFPEKNVDWLKNICVKPQDDRFAMTFTPVEFTRLTPDELKAKGPGLKSVVLDDE
jgi:succinate dehydrogenase / fumarate reductase flavoprotein subunit/fumarate reductase flavoprotein subunit